MAQIEIYETIAETALNQYSIAWEKLEFLGHSGNVTFCVEASDTKFLLRIHQSISGVQDDIWQKPKIIVSELLWLAALCRESKIVEAFSILALIDVFSFHVNNPKEHEWLLKEVQYVVEKPLSKYLQDEPFLLNTY